MSIAEVPAPAVAAKPATSRRSFPKALMQFVRRAHLYLGLFLLPWAILYGVTAFLFNHPGAFSEQASTSFARSDLSDTPMAELPDPKATAAEVVAGLNARAGGGASYALAGDAHFTRDFAFATVKTADGETVNILFDVVGGGGTIRAQPKAPEAKKFTPAPFAVGGTSVGPAPKAGGKGGGGRGGRGAGVPEKASDPLKVDGPLHERVKAAVPVALERKGFDGGEVTVTSVPDVAFKMTDADGTAWNVTYNAMAGTVAGRRADEETPKSVGVRRFLTRLHLAHGYGSTLGAKWFWALIVDAMAAVMVFWGISGVFMWWQIKSTRGWGLLALAASAVAAGVLTLGMYRVMTG